MPSWLQKVPPWLWRNALCLSQSALINFAPHVISDINGFRLSHWYRLFCLFLRGKERKIAYRLDPSSFCCPRRYTHFSFAFYFKLVYLYVHLRTIPWFMKMSLTRPLWYNSISARHSNRVQSKFLFESLLLLLFFLFCFCLVCFLWYSTSFIAFPHLASL